MKPPQKPSGLPSVSLRGREIVIGVTGSIAAFRAADLASALVHRGAGVSVVMTAAARAFVGPLTFEGITHRPAVTGLFDRAFVEGIRHVSLADLADVVVVAPATANVIGKIAAGIADCPVTTLVAAVDVPVLVAPAMNDRMWANPIVKANVERLRGLGYRFVEPGRGRLACGTVGWGRLAAVTEIVAAIEAVFAAERKQGGRGRSNARRRPPDGEDRGPA